MFAIAAREKLRFSTSKGDISVEQLWDLPCTSERSLCLRDIAKDLILQLKPLGDDFLEAICDDSAQTLQLKMKLDIVKYIYKIKTEEHKASVLRAEEWYNNQRLILEILEIKKLEELKQLSVEEAEMNTKAKVRNSLAELVVNLENGSAQIEDFDPRLRSMLERRDG